MYSLKTKVMFVGAILFLLISALLIYVFRDKIFNSSGSLGSIKQQMSSSKNTTDTGKTSAQSKGTNKTTTNTTSVNTTQSGTTQPLNASQTNTTSPPPDAPQSGNT